MSVCSPLMVEMWLLIQSEQVDGSTVYFQSKHAIQYRLRFSHPVSFLSLQATFPGMDQRIFAPGRLSQCSSRLG